MCGKKEKFTDGSCSVNDTELTRDPIRYSDYVY